MARNKALTDLGDLDLYEQLSDAKEELFNLRFQLLTGQLENHSRLGQVKKEDCNNCVCSNSGEWVCEDNVCGQATDLESESKDQTTIIILMIALIFISVISTILFITNKNKILVSNEFSQWDSEDVEDKKKVKLPPMKPPKSD